MDPAEEIRSDAELLARDTDTWERGRVESKTNLAPRRGPRLREHTQRLHGRLHRADQLNDSPEQRPSDLRRCGLSS
jgi:hypothetical protein